MLTVSPEKRYHYYLYDSQTVVYLKMKSRTTNFQTVVD